MTITLTKKKLAALIGVAVLVIPATAVATHSFVDVADDAFYGAATEWAKTNNITTGSPAGSDTFRPTDPVTRGESVTFLKRYDDNIVEPGLADLAAEIAAKADGSDVYTKAEVDAALATEVITAGAANLGPVFVPQTTLLPESFTTTTSGRLRITLSYRVGVACTPAAASPRYLYLVVDDVPVEASISIAISNTMANHISIGTTTDVIPAGNHSIYVGAECQSPNTTGASAADGNAIYEITVLSS